MPAWRCEAETLITAALGAPPSGWIAWGEALPAAGSALPSLVLSVVGQAPAAAARAGAFTRIGDVLAAGGTLVVVDHNRPRRSWAALRALFGAPRVPGFSPAARWRRLAHPTARQVQAAGFRVERLRLAAGERVQVVIARK